MTKTYELEDFLTATLADKPAKMPLLRGKVDTKQYLLVLGANSPKIKRPLIEYRFKFAKIKEEALKIDNEVDREFYLESETELIDIELASHMVTGSSFKKDDKETAVKILEENHGLSNIVIAFSFDNEKYLAKKQ